MFISENKTRRRSDPIIKNHADWKTYSAVGRVMNPYRQINPEGQTPKLPFMRKAEEFVNSHPKLRSGLDIIGTGMKETSHRISLIADNYLPIAARRIRNLLEQMESNTVLGTGFDVLDTAFYTSTQRIFELAQIAAQRTMSYLNQCLADYLEAKEKEDKTEKGEK